MTVSNALNGRHDRLSEATLQRVLETVDRLGYVRSASARSLSANRSNIVSLVYQPTSRTGAGAALGQHDALFLGELELHITRAGLYLMVHSTTDATSTARSLKTWNVDAAIFLSTLGDEVEVLRRAHDVPMVFVDNYASSPLISSVRVDDFRGGYLAGERLAGAGHRRIAFVGPSIYETGVVRQRYLGFVRALEDHGIVHDPALIRVCPTEYEPALALAGAMTEELPDVTAAFATSDDIAAGLVNGFRTAGRVVPEQVSVIGFDDIDLARVTNPQLTTIRQDIPAKARATAEMIERQLALGAERESDRVMLDVRLIERGTVSAVSALSGRGGL